MTLLRGALIAFSPSFLGIPDPEVVTFQYNPDTVVHNWNQHKPSAPAPGGCRQHAAGNPVGTHGPPSEQFELTAQFDSNEDIANANPGSPIAKIWGVYPRLAALEMLLFPVGSGLASVSSAGTGGIPSPTANAAASAAGGAGSLVNQVSAPGAAAAKPTATVPQATVPITLFVWGPFRIVPVRLASMVVTETQYDDLLNPVHASAKLTLNVLTPADLKAAADQPLTAKLATVAYDYTLGFRAGAAFINTSVNGLPGALTLTPG